MARSMKGESEFGLPVMARFAPDGSVVSATDTKGRLPLAENDAEAVATGADLSMASQLRAIYSTDADAFGKSEPKAGTA